MFFTAPVYPLFPAVVTTLLWSQCAWWKNLVVCPYLLVVGLAYPISDVFVEHCPLCQKGDPFVHHHGIRNCLTSCSLKFSPLFQLFYQSIKGFRRVVAPHHFYGIFLEVDFVYHPIVREKVLEHGECEHLSEPCYLFHQ